MGLGGMVLLRVVAWSCGFVAFVGQQDSLLSSIYCSNIYIGKVVAGMQLEEHQPHLIRSAGWSW